MTASYSIRPGSLTLLANGDISATLIFPEISEEDGNEDSEVIGHASAIDANDYPELIRSEIERLTDRWFDIEADASREQSREEWEFNMIVDFQRSAF